MRHLTTRRTAFQSVAVWGDDQEVEFRVTGAIHAWWGRDQFLTGLAWDNIAAGVLSFPGHPAPGGPPKSLLMLGLGGGTSLRTLRHLCPDLEITAIEIDAEMIELARGHMDLDAIGARIITGDAYAWLRTCRRKFDVIFDDVYGVTSTDVERPLPSPETLLPAIRRSLSPQGIFAANLVIGPGHRRVQTEFRRFFRENFPVVRSITTPASLNECLIGGPALRPWRGIRPLAKAFPSDTDYSFWRRLQARRLPSAGPG
ncbi:MAG: methyltransferase domain-containing protein [Verrucomicrobiota bacterium]